MKPARSRAAGTRRSRRGRHARSSPIARDWPALDPLQSVQLFAQQIGAALGHGTFIGSGELPGESEDEGVVSHALLQHVRLEVLKVLQPRRRPCRRATSFIGHALRIACCGCRASPERAVRVASRC